MMNACEREAPTELLAYIAVLKMLGFRLWVAKELDGKFFKFVENSSPVV